MIMKYWGVLAALLFVACSAWAEPQLPLNQQEREWIALHPVVRFAIDPQWRPIEFLDGGRARGLSIDYLQAVGRATGLAFELKVTGSWSESVQALASGEVDILPSAFDGLPVSGRVPLLFSRPYHTGVSVIVSEGRVPVVFDASQLLGRTIAVEKAGKSEQWFQAHHPNIKLLSLPTEQSTLDAVVSGQAQAAIVTDSVAYPLLHARYGDRLHVAGTVPDAPAIIRMAMRPDEALLASIIDKSLSSIGADEAEAIDDRWLNPTDYTEPSLETIFKFFGRELWLVLLTFVVLVTGLYAARRAQKAAVQSERQKSMFLAMMSHEIRTPINAILSAIELLRMAKLSRQERNLVDVANSSAEVLFKLLSDVLDYSKFQASGVSLEMLPSDPAQVAREALDLVAQVAKDKHLTLHFRLPDDRLPIVLIDPTRLRQVLLNLLSNAVKFTERGTVTLTLEFTGQGDRDWLAITVEDTGIGIPEVKRDQLFHAFSQAESSITRRFGGTGLGLVICRELVHAMGGTIGLDSAERVGTVVTVRLPVSPVQRDPEADVPPFLITGRASTRYEGTILLVEDHAANQLVIQQQLEHLGFASEVAPNGAAALEAFHTKSYLAILLDCHLPGMDGYDIAVQMRDIERVEGFPHTPILAISATIDPAHFDRCMRSGMDGVLTKPLRLRELSNALHLWLATDPGEPAAVSKDFPFEDTKELFARICREDIGALKSAWLGGDVMSVAHWLHRIKGAARMVAFDEMESLAVKLEGMSHHSPCLIVDREAPLSLISRMENSLSHYMADFSGRS